MFKELDIKKGLLDSRRPLPKENIERIREDLILEWIYNSNLMEFNSLTLIEAKVVLGGVTVGGKTIREHIEVLNDKEAILYIEQMVRGEESLSELEIQNINRILLNGINDKYSGRYRDNLNLKSEIRSTEAELPLIKERMESFLEWYKTDAQKLHPVERASMIYILLTEIQPFVDGNGRTARLLLNFELMRMGYPPIVFGVDDISVFQCALNKAKTVGDNSDFVEIIKKEINKSMDAYLKAI